MHLSTMILIFLTTSAMCSHCLAQARPCLTSIHGDGHPLFGSLSTPLLMHGQLARVTSVVSADFNGDGIPDIAATLYERNEIAVAVGRGDGWFEQPVYLQAGAGPIMVITSDLSENQHPDIAVVNEWENTVTILLNLGDGTFAPGAHHPVGPRPRSVAAGDVTGNGLVDLITLNLDNQSLSLLRNTGAGTFAPEARIDPGYTTLHGAPWHPGPHIVLGDFNGNGHLDLVVPQQHQVRLMLNDGTGSFAPGPAAILHNGDGAYAIAAADLNNDGHLDLAVTTTLATPQTLHVLINDGAGAFHPPVSYDVAADPYVPGRPARWTIQIAAVDLDRNGHVDLVAAQEVSGGYAAILRNRGDGTFHSKELFAAAGVLAPMVIDDLDGDGYPDWLVADANSTYPTAAVLLNDGTGRPMAMQPHWTPLPPANYCCPFRLHPVAADLDGSGRPDLVMTTYHWNYHVVISRNDGGRFTDLPPIALAPPGEARADAVAVADLNGDGIPDLVISDTVDGGLEKTGNIHILFGLGNLQYAPPHRYPLPGTPRQVVAEDLNGNGQIDLAVWLGSIYPGDEHTPVPRQVAVLFNDGTGSFSLNALYMLENIRWGTQGALAAGRIHGGNLPDLVAGWGDRDGPGRVGVLRNRGDGTFDPPAVIETSRLPQSIIAADLRGLGRIDLAVMHNFNHWVSLANPAEMPYLTILHNDGAGALPTRQEFINPSALPDGQMAVGDLNGNGLLDIAVPQLVWRDTVVHLNNGAGSFAPAARYHASHSSGTWGLAIADFDGDGRNDIAVTTRFHVDLLTMRNVGCSAAGDCYANCDGSTQAPILTVEDFNCFINEFATAQSLAPAQQIKHYANCDGSTTPPILNVDDFICFINAFAQGCP
jgi:hypothetical protein